MVAGLPGTGIGGLYYLLLAFLMPVHELCLLCRGRSSLRRWRMILMQLANASGVLGSLALASWLIRLGSERMMGLANHVLAGTATHRACAAELAAQEASVRHLQAVTSVSLAWLTVAALAAVVLGILVWGEIALRWETGRRRRGGCRLEAPSVQPLLQLQEAAESI